jgi:hypothetical protein
MSSSLTTTYFGHRIVIEPFEWGYLAQIVKPGSDERLIAANASAMQALEDAFELVDSNLRGAEPADGMALPPPPSEPLRTRSAHGR